MRCMCGLGGVGSVGPLRAWRAAVGMRQACRQACRQVHPDLSTGQGTSKAPTSIDIIVTAAGKAGGIKVGEEADVVVAGVEDEHGEGGEGDGVGGLGPGLGQGRRDVLVGVQLIVGQQEELEVGEQDGPLGREGACGAVGFRRGCSGVRRPANAQWWRRAWCTELCGCWQTQRK